jgi:HPt (histidine-containing phosphotransfer) domain-containing protein
MPRQDYAGRVEFTSGLSDRLAQIRCALGQLRQRPHDCGLFAETRNSARELAGTAGSFGLEELSEIALRVEQALLAWQARGAAPTAWAAVADADAALADFEDRVAPAAPAVAWRVVRAGL